MKYRLLILLMFIAGVAKAESLSHALWLNMKPSSRQAIVVLKGKATSITTIAKAELTKYSTAKDIELQYESTVPLRENDILSATGAVDSYTISVDGEKTIIKAATDRGLLYAAYELLRSQQTGRAITSGMQSPVHAIRCLNHWDNPNGTVERGYAGNSIFWNRGEVADKRRRADSEKLWREYARANASVGINATVINNVNAKPLVLSVDTLRKVARIANVLRPYGMRVYLAVNFASPKALGDLSTADPLNSEVRAWWSRKVREIYRLIPDFGGFLVKANSEGEPGPMDYGRSHVDGANMLAEALEPYGGLVMWRAFVYAAKGGDRASQAYDEFVPFDGQFYKNVIIQIKNGPIDFQPREPLSPLFFGLKRTQMMPEVQITQEYTGHSIHTCFLAPMWKEALLPSALERSSVTPGPFDAIAGVANIGDNDNWCGSDMAQANWYAFGRLAWSNELTSRQIADEWLKQTFSTDNEFVGRMTNVMLRSYEAVVDYMMPLGLHHIFAGGHHYGPEPWCNPEGWRIDWLPRFYHRADTIGIGFNRSTKIEACLFDSVGSGNVLQYPEPLSTMYDNISTCPEHLLLWFHHVPWNYTLHNGLTLWDNLCLTYDRGVREAELMAHQWNQMKRFVDPVRFAAQKVRFDRQATDAWWWRDACLLYFQQFSRMELPADAPTFRHSLDELMKFNIPIDNYRAPRLEQLP